MRELGAVGLTTREACGDTVRNVMGCHLAGACPHEMLDVTPWAEAAFRHFVRNPLGQRLPRKFKINFSGCETDCGQAMFNDVGVIAVTRTARRRHDRGRLPGVHRRRTGRQPAPRARPSSSSPPAKTCCRRSRSVLRVFEQTGNRDNKLRARLKWVVDQLGSTRSSVVCWRCAARCPPRRRGPVASPRSCRRSATRAGTGR